MQNWRRIFYFLLLNILVSAVTVWVVGTIIFRNQPAQPASVAPTLVSQSDGGTGDLVVTETAAVPDQPEEIIEITPELLEIEVILGYGELETEQVLIKHIGEKEVSLVGWQLQDQDGNVFTFPALTMFQGGAVTVYTRRRHQHSGGIVLGAGRIDLGIWRAGLSARS